MVTKELENVNHIAIFILRKLYNDRKIGGRAKGLPKHMGHCADKAIKYLFKQRLIMPKPTGYGKHVSLNPNQLPKIEEMLGIEK